MLALGMMGSKRWEAIIAAVAFAALGAPTSAVAAFVPQPNTAYNGYSPDRIDLTIPVIATIGGRCGFADNYAPQGALDAGLIDTADWSGEFDFMLECTGPSRIAVVSSNGGLKTDTPAAPGYLNLAPYNVGVHVARIGGAASGSCQSSSLATDATDVCALRGPASTDDGLIVASPSYRLSGSYLTIGAPKYLGPGVLMAGTYRDTLTVTISPAS